MNDQEAKDKAKAEDVVISQALGDASEGEKNLEKKLIAQLGDISEKTKKTIDSVEQQRADSQKQ